MSLFIRSLFVLLLVSFNAEAYKPKGLRVMEYPVNIADVSLISEDNSSIRVLESDADLTVMIFWTKSCYPCLKEMKQLEKLYPEAKKDNIRIMVISPASNWKSNTEERKLLTKYGAPTIPFYNDVEDKLSLSLGIGSTPYTVIMDKAGKKVATIQGSVNWDSSKLYKQIKELIK